MERDNKHILKIKIRTATEKKNANKFTYYSMGIGMSLHNHKESILNQIQKQYTGFMNLRGFESH
jgi:hypothetical protein